MLLHRADLGPDDLGVARSSDLEVKVAATGLAQAHAAAVVDQGHPDGALDLHGLLQALVDVRQTVQLPEWLVWRHVELTAVVQPIGLQVRSVSLAPPDEFHLDHCIERPAVRLHPPNRGVFPQEWDSR